MKSDSRTITRIIIAEAKNKPPPRKKAPVKVSQLPAKLLPGGRPGWLPPLCCLRRKASAKAESQLLAKLSPSVAPVCCYRWAA